MPRIARHRARFTRVPLHSIEKINTKCIEMTDLSRLDFPANFLLRGDGGRNPEFQIARLCEQFIRDNRGIMHDFGVSVDSKFDGQNIYLSFHTKTSIGALPLLSPTSGKPDYGLIIKPRFEWSGLGPMLSFMGWKVVPMPLKLPLIPGTERKVPPWVLASIILQRIQALLNQLNRTFQFSESDLMAPRGTINWNIYATERIPNVKFLSIPCKFPTISDNEELKSAIHYTLRKLLSSLESQRTSGIFILQLIEKCLILIAMVNKINPRQPSSKSLQYWYNLPLRSNAFREGLQSIEWTIDDRGLAGISEVQGLPWIMPMESFFEAWLETIALCLTRKIGGIVRSGRKRETITPISWDPPFRGSQKFLLPDVIIERENDVIILDAKYKDHWEDMNFASWSNVEEEIREKHREDIFQVLAYSTTIDKPSIKTCLIYPCKETTWNSMKSRDRLFHRASIYSGHRKVDLILTALPMHSNISDAIEGLSKSLAD